MQAVILRIPLILIGENECFTQALSESTAWTNCSNLNRLTLINDKGKSLQQKNLLSDHRDVDIYIDTVWWIWIEKVFMKPPYVFGRPSQRYFTWRCMEIKKKPRLSFSRYAKKRFSNLTNFLGVTQLH